MFLLLFHSRIFTWSHQHDVIFKLFLFSLLLALFSPCSFFKLQIDFMRNLKCLYSNLLDKGKRRKFIFYLFLFCKSDFESSLMQIILLCLLCSWFVVTIGWNSLNLLGSRFPLCQLFQAKFFLLAQWIWSWEACIWPELQCPLEIWR